MNTVYIVVFLSDSKEHMIYAFDSREKAEEYIRKCNQYAEMSGMPTYSRDTMFIKVVDMFNPKWSE